MNRFPARTFVVAAILLVVASGPVLAESGPILDLDELGAASVAVVRGHVYSVDAGWGDIDSIYTYVRVDVDEVLAGAGVPDRIIVKQLGGVVGDLGLYVGGAPTFAPGEEVVLFLTLRPRDNTVYPAGFWQGKWQVERFGGAALARRNAGFDEHGAEVMPERVALDEIRAAVAGERPVARAPLAVQYAPAEAPVAWNTVLSPSPQKFSLLGFSWHEAFSGVATKIHFHRKRQPKVGIGRKQIRRTVRDWNAVPRTLKAFKKGGKRRGAGTGTSLRANDPSIVLFNLDPNKEISDTDGTLAIGGAWSSGVTIRNLGKGTSGFIVMNDGQQNFLRNKTCYQNILSHEGGHAMGSGHSNSPGNLMFPSISFGSCSGSVLKLGNDDQRGHRKMYHRRFGRLAQ